MGAVGALRLPTLDGHIVTCYLRWVRFAYPPYKMTLYTRVGRVSAAHPLPHYQAANLPLP